MPDLETTITTVAAEPKEAAADGVSAKQHPLPDLIAADRYLAGKTARADPRTAMKLCRIVPPGAAD
jgi:hypothetical protein